MPILWGVEFAARGDAFEITLEEFGWTAGNFWPGALKSNTWEDKPLRCADEQRDHGLHLQQAEIFADMGSIDVPATWDDVVAYSNQIKQETGKNGYGMVCKVNAGNAPFRFVPVAGPMAAARSTKAVDSPT